MSAGDDRTPLATLLQISDLHIGELDPTTGHAALSAAMVPIYSNFTIFDGVLGHHSYGLQELAEFYASIVHEKPYVVMTGDLTQIGRQADFENGEDYLSGTLDINPPTGNKVGLSRPNWKGFAIPGNHDHWPGLPFIFGGPPTALAMCFASNLPPFIRDPIPLANGRTLRFAGINTDADVNPKGNKRLRAVGSFQTQLAKLAPRLKKRPPEEIRVLLSHHSWHRRGLFLSMDRASRGALSKFLVVHGIQVLMTGHTHGRRIDEIPASAPGGQDVIESRCGTSTQIDQVPWTWKNLAQQLSSRQWPENSLIVHRLYDSDGTTTWEAQAYWRKQGSGFVKAKMQRLWEV